MFQVCRACGCTNFSACAPGCWWVDDDLCSSCAVAVDVASGAVMSLDELAGIEPALAKLLAPDTAPGTEALP